MLSAQAFWGGFAQGLGLAILGFIVVLALGGIIKRAGRKKG